jgi:lipoprotein-releasing system ATP-binding protein
LRSPALRCSVGFDFTRQPTSLQVHFLPEFINNPDSKAEDACLLEVSHLTKEYPTPRGPLPILADISLKFERGDAAAIMGPSGSGKSTFLYTVGALEPPTSGEVLLEGQNPFKLNEAAIAAFRNQKIGFVFQDHCLLPQCSVLENVLVPTLVADGGAQTVERAKRLLSQVGLSERLDHLPAELSGGEKQRVAIARALIREPLLLLCDEPTGNLDREAAENVASLLLDLHRQQQTILLIVTHSADLAARLPVRYELIERQLRRI